jgi:hypothetical protein
MNVSAACPQCGTIANPNDRFCNTCGTPLQRAPVPGGPAAQAPQAQPQYGQPPPQGQPYPAPGYPPAQQSYPQQPYGAPAARPARCQVGHEIMPGMSYCSQGHPLALDAMQFANDPNAAYAQAQAPQQPPQYAPQGYGAPQPGGGSPFDAPRAAPPPQQGGFGAPQGYPQQQGYGAPQPQYAPQPVFQGAAVPPPPAGQYAPPPPPGAYAAEAGPGAIPANGKLLRGFLVSFQTNPSGDFWPLFTGRTTLGRANAPEPGDIPLADATISSRHAVLFADANVVVVEDTSSTNGTYVNEEHIGQNGKRELRDGDRVRFGGYTTLVKLLGRIG